MNNKQSVLDMIGTIAKYVVIAVLILFFISLSRTAYDTGYSVFAQSAVDEAGQGHTVTVEITADMSVRQIGELLEREGLIENSMIFVVQERFSSYHGELTPGTYTLSTEMTPDEMIEVMAENYSEETDAGGSSETGESAESESAASETSSEDTPAEESGEASSGEE
ncbi:MAG: endolytic transglycosylase MltG [Eubacteriales bacterium]|nr:endolytic transglycosylase MltG [Eubacteriales bacterium]